MNKVHKKDNVFFYRYRFLLEFLYVQDILKDKVDLNKIIEDYDNGNVVQLQDFIGKYLKNEHTWMTCIGLIDAMDIVYKDAISNGNIDK